MSQRVKRPNRTDDGCIPTKRRKRPTMEEEEAASLAAAASWQPRPFNDLKSIYNRTATEAPAELFRKDLISAMKLPDSEPLASDEYWVIVDQWKQEWERGVQVPVNPDSLPAPSVTVNQNSTVKPHQEFKIPKTKYIRITKDEHFHIEKHVLSTAPAKSEAACSYDLDETDVAWLKLLNGERATCGLSPVSEEKLERVIERLEVNCWDKIQSILRNEEGLGIEYDENVICDVCRSPDSEEGNEMVFCDSCNICVHQACYGITRIPEGQWLCGTCALSQRPECVLCPNKGGAMKATRSGQKWAHVSCALWIPEVSIGCVEKMEPITKVSSIPQSRWALICVLCRERVGACIQCSVKTCKTAYHVTCAFKHGLEMRAIIEDENADDGVKLRSYCEKHSKTSKKEKSTCSGSEDDDNKRKKRKDMTSEEKNQARAARLHEIEAEFDKHVNIKDINMRLDVDSQAFQYIYNYWKLKRRAGNNKPLLPPKSEDVDMLSNKQEQADLEKMKTFVQLRQDLERVRNLCYMVSRREKLSRTFFRMREQTFHKQAAVLDSSHMLPTSILHAIVEANHGPSIYDRLYSHSDAEDHTDFEIILARIAGLKTKEDKKPEVNGLLKSVKKENPYKRTYFNGSSKRRSASLYGGSTSDAGVRSSSEEQNDFSDFKTHVARSGSVTSSVGEEKPTALKRKAGRPRLSKKRRKHLTPRNIKVDTSSEDDVKVVHKSRLQQVKNDLGMSGTESDECNQTRSESQRSKVISSIYSESDSSNASNSQRSALRTKAAVKEFLNKPSTSKSPSKTSPTNKKKSKAMYIPSDLFVPQREAAKKASENMKSSTTTRVISKDAIDQPAILETKPASPEIKVKTKQKKDAKVTPKKEKSTTIDIFDIENDKEDEILSYVPQRQAAKKATENIKSGLGKPVPPTVNDPSSDRDKPHSEVTVKPAKIQDDKRKSSTNTNSSTSSAASSSSDSSDSSSTESDSERNKPQLENLVQPKRTTTAKDWPFLDKVAKSEASGGTEHTRAKKCPTSTRTESLGNLNRRRPSKSKSSNRDSDVRSRDIFNSQTFEERGKNWKGKSHEMGESFKKEITKPNNLFSSIRKEDKRLDNIEYLEREILERKANRDNTNNKSKTNIDRLFSDKANIQSKKLYNLQKHSNKSDKHISAETKRTFKQTACSKSESSASESSDSLETRNKYEKHSNQLKSSKTEVANKMKLQRLHEKSDHTFGSFSKLVDTSDSEKVSLSNKYSFDKNSKRETDLPVNMLKSSRHTLKSSRKLNQNDFKMDRKIDRENMELSLGKSRDDMKSFRKTDLDSFNSSCKKHEKGELRSPFRKSDHDNIELSSKKSNEDDLIDKIAGKKSKETSRSILTEDKQKCSNENFSSTEITRHANSSNRQTNYHDNKKLSEKHSKHQEKVSHGFNTKKESHCNLELHEKVDNLNKPEHGNLPCFENEMSKQQKYCEIDVSGMSSISKTEQHDHHSIVVGEHLKLPDTSLEKNHKNAKYSYLSKTENLDVAQLTEKRKKEQCIENSSELPNKYEKTTTTLHEKQLSPLGPESPNSEFNLHERHIRLSDKSNAQSIELPDLKIPNRQHTQNYPAAFDAHSKFSQKDSILLGEKHLKSCEDNQIGFSQKSANMSELPGIQQQTEAVDNYHSRLPEIYEKHFNLFEKHSRIPEFYEKQKNLPEKYINITEQHTTLSKQTEHYINIPEKQYQPEDYEKLTNSRMPEIYQNLEPLEIHEKPTTHTVPQAYEKLPEKQHLLYEKSPNVSEKQSSLIEKPPLFDRQTNVSEKQLYPIEKYPKLPEKSSHLLETSSNLSDTEFQLYEKQHNLPEKPFILHERQSQIYEKPSTLLERQAHVYEKAYTLSEKQSQLYEKPSEVSEIQCQLYEKPFNLLEKQPQLYEKTCNIYDKQPQSYEKTFNVAEKHLNVYEKPSDIHDKQSQSCEKTFSVPDEQSDVPEKPSDKQSHLYELSHNLSETQCHSYEKSFTLPEKRSQLYEKPPDVHERHSQSYDKPLNLPKKFEKPSDIQGKQSHSHEKSSDLREKQSQSYGKQSNFSEKQFQSYDKSYDLLEKQSQPHEKPSNLPEKQHIRLPEKQQEIYENLSSLSEKQLNMFEQRYPDSQRLSEVYQDIHEKHMEVPNKTLKSLELNDVVESFEKHTRFQDYAFAFNQQFSENALGFADFGDFGNNYKMRMFTTDTAADDYTKLLEKPTTNKLENNPSHKAKNDVIKPTELVIPLSKGTDEQTTKTLSPPLNKEGELLDFDMLEDGFGISKAPLGFSLGNVTLFKEDSKEDSARETLNLVEKLRMELSKKSSSSHDIDDTTSIASSTATNRNEIHNETDDPAVKPLEIKNENVPKENATNVLQGSLDPSTTLQADERWVPPSKSDVGNAPLMLHQPTPYLEQYSPSPYADIHPQAKWADSQVMPTRRSSSSSAASTPSSCSHSNEERPDVMVMDHPNLEIQFGGSVLHQFQSESYTAQFSDPQFINPVSLFPPPAPNFNTQIPFPSPGAAMFPPVYHTPTPLSKPVESTVCTAAFTSSEHNMALTAAMVNVPTPTPTETAPSPKPTPTPTPAPASTGKKSPSKPTRTSARFLNKSPEKSPRTVDTSKTTAPSRGRGDKRGGSRGLTRGRGRGRGRGKSITVPPPHQEYDTINKLVGTVYDFDFDDENDSMADLKSLRERRKSADIHVQSPKLNDTVSPKLPPVADCTPPLPPIVEPVLPGPVDMRTYNNFDESQSYNLLSALSAAEPTVHEDVDEDFEKTLPEIANNIKASLSDSRNQLKVKIKGPIANYTASAPTPATTSNASANNVINNVAVGMSSGTSNLRRMRKKELLRQYWTQENMDDNATVPGIAAVPAVVPINRTIITIPKAVASMTSIPTRDDYRDYRTGTEDIAEPKVRKETKARPGGLSRELKQLDLPSEGADAGPSERRRKPAVKTAPKLKIKIAGKHSIITDRIRPPKKRLSTIAQPSVEDLKRESMKFRKMVMADFGDRKKKKDKSSKHHKRKKRQQVEIVSNEDVNSTKLIIRFNRKADSECENKKSNSDESIVNDQKLNNSVEVLKDTENNVRPIKLKIARCQAGSGYIMKTEEAPRLPEPPLPLPLNKDCEVR